MEKFEYNGVEFNIKDSFNASDHEGHYDYEVKETDRTIVKTMFTIFPLWIGKKFRWFKKCRVRYRLYLSRRKEFDDGWTYSYYWTKWKHEFRMEEILD